MEYLSSALRNQEVFDIVVADVPTFSNSKDASDFDVQVHHPRLFRALIAVLAPDGIAYFSTHSRRFQVAPDLNEIDIVEVTHETIPEDFRNKCIHRCFRLQAK